MAAHLHCGWIRENQGSTTRAAFRESSLPVSTGNQFANRHRLP